MSDISGHDEHTAGPSMHAGADLIEVVKPVVLRHIHVHVIGVVMLAVDATHDVDGTVEDSDAGLADAETRAARRPDGHRRRLEHLDDRHGHREPVRVLDVSADDVESVADGRHAVVAARMQQRRLVPPRVADRVVRDHTSTVSVELLPARHVDPLSTHGRLHTHTHPHTRVQTPGYVPKKPGGFF